MRTVAKTAAKVLFPELPLMALLLGALWLLHNLAF
jgi:hypothetical protein